MYRTPEPIHFLGFQAFLLLLVLGKSFNLKNIDEIKSDADLRLGSDSSQSAS